MDPQNGFKISKGWDWWTCGQEYPRNKGLGRASSPFWGLKEHNREVGWIQNLNGIAASIFFLLVFSFLSLAAHTCWKNVTTIVGPYPYCWPTSPWFLLVSSVSISLSTSACWLTSGGILPNACWYTSWLYTQYQWIYRNWGACMLFSAVDNPSSTLPSY